MYSAKLVGREEGGRASSRLGDLIRIIIVIAIMIIIATVIIITHTNTTSHNTNADNTNNNVRLALVRTGSRRPPGGRRQAWPSTV